MIYGYPTTNWVIGGSIVALLLAVVGYAVYRHQKAKVEQEVDDLAARADEAAADSDGAGHTVELEPPNVGSSIWGLIGMWRHRAKETRLARKGYIKWYKLGARRQRPTWVNPSYEGAGELEYYDKGDEVTYLFPKEAMVPDSQTGAWVAEHRVGEVEPINLRDPAAPALDADRLEEVINLEAESDAPSWFSRMNISTTTLMWGMIGLAFVAFAAYRYMGGA